MQNAKVKKAKVQVVWQRDHAANAARQWLLERATIDELDRLSDIGQEPGLSPLDVAGRVLGPRRIWRREDIVERLTGRRDLACDDDWIATFIKVAVLGNASMRAMMLNSIRSAIQEKLRLTAIRKDGMHPPALSGK